MNRRPRIGEVVALNDHGIAQIGGLQSAAQVRQSQRMVVIECEPADTVPPAWAIGVDQALFEGLLLTNLDVDALTEH